MSIKIGVLVPNSNYIPFLPRDYPQALEPGLSAYKDLEYELYVEPAGYNADKNIVTDKIQSLLIKNQVDIIVAPLNVGLLEPIKEHLNAHQTPLIVNSMGEDVIFNTAQSPYLFINTFNVWQSCWMMGYWAAENLGKQACSIAALHDSGYGMSFAFGLGLEAKNGALLQTAVTHRESRTEDPSGPIKDIAKNKPDFIMGYYSGKEALSFLQAYHESGYKDKFPLIGLPFMVDETILEELGELTLGIRSVYCWSKDTEAHRHFMGCLADKTEHRGNCYTLLAYETGHLIAKAYGELGSGEQNGNDLTAALKAVSFEGPRGTIQFEPETREVKTMDYLTEVVKGKDGKYHNKVVAHLEKPALFDEQLVMARKNLSKQGWLNPYLCA